MDNTGKRQKRRLTDNLIQIQKTKQYMTTESDPHRMALLILMIDEWEVDYSNLTNMMRMTATEFDTMLTNYRPCIGSNVKRLQHYVNMTRQNAKEADGGLLVDDGQHCRTTNC